MIKPIPIQWICKHSPEGGRGSFTQRQCLSIHPLLCSIGILRWHLVSILLICIFYPTLLNAALPDPNQVDSASLSQEAKLLEELHAVVQTLREERMEYYEKLRSLESHIQQKRNDLATLENEVAPLRTSEEQVDQDLQRMDQDIRQLALELESKKSQQEQIQKAMNNWVIQGCKAVDAGIPFRQKERRERLISIASKQSENASDSGADTLGRIWSFFQEEMRLARSGETFTEQIDIGKNRLTYAQLFRVGHQILGYLTEDGRETGLWLDRNGQKQWRHTLAEDDAKAALTAVEILDRRQQPKLTSLPVSIRIDRERKEQELDGENTTKE
jgi:uncharacterized protein YoxC